MSARAEAVRNALPSAPLFAYWHLLSLDAPTVAVVWCCAFAAFAGIRLPLYVLAALAITTWILYVADRLLDVRQTRSTENLRQRHWFHDRYSTAFLAGLTIAALLLGWIAARELCSDVVRCEMALGVVVVLYFAVIHSHVRRITALRRIPLKEILVGTIFSFAVAIPSWTRERPAPFYFAVFGFAALCTLNCLAIEAMDRPSRDAPTMTGRSKKLLLLLAAILLGALALHGSSGQHFLFLSIAISALLLFALCHLQKRISSLTFRVAADAALLAPLLFAPWHWMHP